MSIHAGSVPDLPFAYASVSGNNPGHGHHVGTALVMFIPGRISAWSSVASRRVTATGLFPFWTLLADGSQQNGSPPDQRDARCLAVRSAPRCRGSWVASCASWGLLPALAKPALSIHRLCPACMLKLRLALRCLLLDVGLSSSVGAVPTYLP